MAKLRIIKTYFLEILLIFTITVVTTMVMLSWFLNYHFERSITHIVNELNQDFLAESHRINEYLQKMIKMSGMELFFEPSIQKLMYQEELSNFDVVSGIRRLDAVMSTNIHTHSIYVYNADKQYIYATSNVDSDSLEKFKDTEILELLSGSADTKRLSPIPRYAQGPAGEVPVYSFIFYDIQRTEPHIRGALVINITTEWLREVFRDVDPLHSQIVFVDGQGTIAYHTNPALFLKNIAETPIFTQMVQNKDDAKYFLLEAEGKKNYVFYSKSQDSPLYLLRIYPYSAIMGGIIMLRRSTLILVMLCILIALALAAIMSRKLYKPIRLLVRHLDTTHERPREQDELGYLSTSIERMVTEAESFEETTQSYRKLLQTDILREVLLGKIGDPTLVLDQFKEYKLPFATDVPYQIIGLHPSVHIVVEQVGPHMMGIEFDRSLLLVTQNCLSPQIQALADQAIANGCRLVVVSRYIDHPYQLSRRAFRILEELRFSFVHEKGTVLEERELKRCLTSGPYPTELEKSVINHLQRGQGDEAYALYQEFFSHVSLYSFNHFRFAMKRFYISLQLLIKELQDTGCFFSYQEGDIESFEDSLETVQERATIDTFFCQWFDRFQQAIQHNKDQKNQLVAMQVKALFASEYNNPNVCLQYVADAVQLSPTYLSKIFKASEGISFGEYCLRFRMEKASALLSETETAIREIAAAVGFSNENYFYTVFRKQVGITPNEFRQQDRLQ